MCDEVLPPGIGKYEDFHTIDWQRDLAYDRMRHRHIVRKKASSKFQWLKATMDAGSGWLCVLLVGMFAGEKTVLIFLKPVLRTLITTSNSDPVWSIYS